MSEASRQPKDKNYNLISQLYHSADVVETLKTYKMPRRKATKSWWTSSVRPWRTTWRPPSGPRSCSRRAWSASESKRAALY
jgi:hypothetical protein